MPCTVSEPASKPDRPHEACIRVMQKGLYVRHGGLPRVLQGAYRVSPMRIAGVILIVAGALALAYGGFSFTKETHKAEVGPLKFSVQEKERVNIPQWGGLGAILVGVVLLVAGKKK